MSLIAPNTLTVLGTYKCTAACKECCFECGPHLNQRKMLPDKFIIKADADAEPQALAAAVAVTPALVYTSLGLLAHVGVAVTAAIAIGRLQSRL